MLLIEVNAMRNPTTLTMQSVTPVTSYTVRFVMGDAEQLLKETVVTGPFIANEAVMKNLTTDALVEAPPFGPALKFNVSATTPNGVSPWASSESFTFGLDAPTLTLA